ncbi:MAG: RidA family protein [Acidobacteria bacterium]|nr:RidA family protein [Acidobacteriota bacterium]
MRRAVASPDAPQPLGPYSAAVLSGNLLFVSGQVPVDPATGAVVGTDITAQTEQVMRNIGALLKAAGLGYEHVVKMTVFLADLNDFTAMNACYGRFLADPPPARATVQVSRLPRDVKIEIDAIASLPHA